jgi:hypothetical protein
MASKFMSKNLVQFWFYAFDIYNNLKKFDLIFFSEIGVMWFLDFSGINWKKERIQWFQSRVFRKATLTSDALQVQKTAIRLVVPLNTTNLSLFSEIYVGIKIFKYFCMAHDMSTHKVHYQRTVVFQKVEKIMSFFLSMFLLCIWKPPKQK